MERASRAVSGEFGDLGFLCVFSVSGSFDPILWIAWVVRWRDLWSGFDLLLCFGTMLIVLSIGGKERMFGGGQDIDFIGFLLVIVLVLPSSIVESIVRLGVLHPCSTTSFWKPIGWELFVQSPLLLFNLGSWIDSAVLLGSPFDRVCCLLVLLYFGKKIPISKPFEFRVFWLLGVDFTLRYVLHPILINSINCLRIYSVCLTLFSILSFLKLFKGCWWLLSLVDVDLLWLSSLFFKGLDLEFFVFVSFSVSIMNFVVRILDLFIPTKSFEIGIQNNCNFCAEFFLIAGTFEVSAWSTVVLKNMYIVIDLFSTDDSTNDNVLLKGENLGANAFVKKEDPLNFEHSLDFTSHMMRFRNHYDYEDDMNNGSIYITGLIK